MERSEGAQMDEQGSPPEVRQALSHPLRREIIGILSADSAPRSTVELRAALGGEIAISRIAYHVAVLERAGCVREAGGPGERRIVAVPK